jgi:hypothetical protein
MAEKLAANTTSPLRIISRSGELAFTANFFLQPALRVKLRTAASCWGSLEPAGVPAVGLVEAPSAVEATRSQWLAAFSRNYSEDQLRMIRRTRRGWGGR